jgi:hypothetical protein
MKTFIASLFLTAALASSASAMEQIGRIDNLVPAAFHTPPGAERMEARQLDPVVRDETLTTTDAGGLLVTFADGSELTLGPNSTAVIDEFVYPGPGQGNATIELVSGVFRFVSGQMDEANIDIDTPVASIGIRGTVIYAAVSHEATVQVTQRGAAYTRSKVTGEIVEVEAGSAVSVDKQGKFSPKMPFGAAVDKAGYDSPEVMLGLVPEEVQAFPGEIEMLPSARDPNAGGIVFALAKPTDMLIHDDNTQKTYLAGFLLWEAGYNPGALQGADVARSRAIGVLTRRTGAIGSAAPRATRAARPRDRSNDVIAGVLTGGGELQQSDWMVTLGDASIHYSESASYGPIGLPDGGAGPIVSLNNAGVPETAMVKTFTMGAGQRVFSLSGFANFVTSEFPRYVGSQYNDTVQVILTTQSGQQIDITDLFTASVNGSNLTSILGAPSPLAGQNAGDEAGQTGWRRFLQRLRVAPGSTVTIEVRVQNVSDTALPSALLINNVVGSGGR